MAKPVLVAKVSKEKYHKASIVTHLQLLTYLGDEVSLVRILVKISIKTSPCARK